MANVDIKISVNSADLKSAVTDVNRLRSGVGQLNTAGNVSGAFFNDQVARIQQIRELTSRTVNPTLFRQLAFEAEKAGTSFDALRFKIDRVNAGRGGAPNVTRSGLTGQQRFGRINLARQGGDVFTGLASGQSPALIAIQQGPQIAEALVDAGFKVPPAITNIGTAILGLAGPLTVLIAVGAAFFKITSDIRAGEEQRLKIIESVNAAINKQITVSRQIREEFDKQLNQQRESRDFDKFLKTSSLAELENRFKTIKQIQELDANTTAILDEKGKLKISESDDSIKRRETLLTLEKQIADLRQRNDEAANDNFNQRFIEFQKAQQREIEAETRRQKSIEDGKKRVEEFGKSVTDLVNNLAAQRGSGNPFVRIFSEAEEAMRRVRETTRGLDDDLRNLLENQQRAINARNLFNQRLDTGLQAIDLRDEAERFRGATDAERINRRIADLEAAGLGEDSQILKSLKLQAQQALQGGTIQERLQRRLDFLNTGGIPTAEQQAEIDRRIITVTQGFNPADLTSRQREEAASARERTADRLAKSEEDAKREQKARDETQVKIEEHLAKLRELAEKSGVEAIIRVIDDTGGKVSSRLSKRASSKDTANYYESQL